MSLWPAISEIWFLTSCISDSLSMASLWLHNDDWPSISSQPSTATSVVLSLFIHRTWLICSKLLFSNCTLRVLISISFLTCSFQRPASVSTVVLCQLPTWRQSSFTVPLSSCGDEWESKPTPGSLKTNRFEGPSWTTKMFFGLQRQTP